MRFLSRRRFPSCSTAGVALASGLPLPGISWAQVRPVFTHGVRWGDVTVTSA